MTERWLAILGIGEDGVESLSAAAKALLQGAELVLGGARHLALAAPLIRGEAMRWPTPIEAAIPAIALRRGRPVAVLASGDPFWFGVGSLLTRSIPAREAVCIPSLSCISLACARLGWAVQETGIVSLCGRPLALLAPLLQPGARLLALSADASTPAAVRAYLAQGGFGGSRLVVLEALGGPCERVHDGVGGDTNALNLIAVEVKADRGARIIPRAPGLPDAMFEHDGQLTKREIRAVTIAALAPRRGELLWDVGCGSGSVGIEWMLCDPANRAIAVDERPDRAARAVRNAAMLGTPGLEVRTGGAPEALADLPAPDAVFIGGGASDAGMLDACWEALRPGGRIVVNGVTIETDAQLMRAVGTRGGTLTRLGVERLSPVGALHGFRPAMTVTQWTAEKP